MNVEYFSSGSQMLDNVLGEGWPVGRLVNIQGDSASGKTYLAELAAAQHLEKWPNCPVWYLDSEDAFMEEYARILKIPIDDINFLEGVHTVEDWYNTLEVITKEADEDDHGLMILDSLDSLSDETELSRKIGDASYGGNKAKKLSELFRRINTHLAEKNITNIVISQLRDQIGGPIAGLKVRSGGRAVEFYSSIVLRLSTIKKIKRVIKGVEKFIGTEVKVKCTKNKVSMPFRECTLFNVFNSGVDDIWTCLEWLDTTGKFNGLERFKWEGAPVKDIVKFARKVSDFKEPERLAVLAAVRAVTKEVWDEIEEAFSNKNIDDDPDSAAPKDEE
jgi:recombination protein RecA